MYSQVASINMQKYGEIISEYGLFWKEMNNS
jgi:hypothetical protein